MLMKNREFSMPSLPHCKEGLGSRVISITFLSPHVLEENVWFTIPVEHQVKTLKSLAMFDNNARFVSVSTYSSDKTTDWKVSEVVFHFIPNTLVKWSMSID